MAERKKSGEWKAMIMFDFFRDMYVELAGLDTDKMREEKMLRKRNNKFVLSRAVKITIRIVGIFYFSSPLSI